MPKVARPSVYFRFPLALLSLTDDPVEFWRYVVGYAAVHNGLRRMEHIDAGKVRAYDEMGEPLSAIGLVAWIEDQRPDLLPDSYNPADARHRAVAVALAPANISVSGGTVPLGGLAYHRPGVNGSIKGGSAAFYTSRYEEVRAHTGAQAEATGKRGPNVTLRSDVLSDMQTGKLSWAEAKVLCAVYSAVGSGKAVTVSYPQIQARADGYRSRKAFEAAAHARGAVPSADVRPSALAPVPPEFKSARRRSGLLRYDEAVGYLRTWPTADGQTFADAGYQPTDVCDVIATAAGVLFNVRPEFMPPEGARMKTGSHDPSTIYAVGDRVLYTLAGVDGLFLGTVSEADAFGVAVERAGESARLRRSESFITPIDAAPALAELVAVAEAAAAAPVEVPEPSLSIKRIRKITADLARLGLYQRVSLGRGKGWVYSHRLDEDGIVEVVAARLDYKAAEKERRQRTESKVAARLAERAAERATAQAEREARLAAYRARVDAIRSPNGTLVAGAGQSEGVVEGRERADVREALRQEKRAQRNATEQAQFEGAPSSSADAASGAPARGWKFGEGADSFVVPAEAPTLTRTGEGNAQRGNDGDGLTLPPPSAPAPHVSADLFGPPALRSTARTGRLGGVGLAEQDGADRAPAPTPTEPRDGQTS